MPAVDKKHPLWGTEGHLSDSESNALRAFSQELARDSSNFSNSSKFNKRNLLRFLRARKFDPAAALAMLRADEEWRNTFREHGSFQSIDFPNLLLMAEEGLVHTAGTDCSGRPVIEVSPSHFHPALVTDDLELVYFAVFYLDALARRSEDAGMDGFTAIVDMDGWSMSNFSLPLTKVAISLLQNHYPERLGQVFVVNPPWVFKAAWRLVLPLLDERTRSKLQVLGKKEVAHAVLEVVPKSVLSVRFGGKHLNYERDVIIVSDLGRDFYSTSGSNADSVAADDFVSTKSESTTEFKKEQRLVSRPKSSRRKRTRDKIRSLLSSGWHRKDAQDGYLKEEGAINISIASKQSENGEIVANLMQQVKKMQDELSQMQHYVKQREERQCAKRAEYKEINAEHISLKNKLYWCMGISVMACALAIRAMVLV